MGAMRYTTLGRSGLEVSRIACGTWQFGGERGSFDEDAAITAVQHARELGVTLFDTARGPAERILGRALRHELDRNRDEVVIVAEGGTAPGGAPPRGAGRARLRQDVESSLRALAVEHIDLYQVHRSDPDASPEETAAALGEMVAEGKIRHAGVSCHGPGQPDSGRTDTGQLGTGQLDAGQLDTGQLDAGQLAAFERARAVETLQLPYHLFRRGFEEAVLPRARERDIGVLAGDPLASGLLTGRLGEDTIFDEADWRKHSPAFAGEALRRNLVVVDRLGELAERRGTSLGQLAIAWVLAQSGVHVALVGARNARTIAESTSATEVELGADDLGEIDRIVAGAVPIGDAEPGGVP